MLIIYDSMTGNVKRFVEKTLLKSTQLCSEMIVNEPFILVTYTIGIGEVPNKVATFVENNREHLVAVAASGNRNWGYNFARSADIISKKYSVPILLKFELSGTTKDVELFTQEVKRIAK